MKTHSAFIVFLWSLSALAAVPSVMGQDTPAPTSPAEIARQDRESIERIADESRAGLDPRTQLAWEQLQTGDDEAAEQVLAQLIETGETGPQFLLERIVWEPRSRILSEEVLADIAGQYEGRQVGFADLLRIVVGVNTAYRNAGFPLARANLPPQDVEDGIVRIELIEARLGEVRREAGRSAPAWAVRSAVGQREGEPLDLQLIERRLLYYNRTRGRGLGAVLESGAEFGTTDMLLNFEGPPRNELALVTDNAGRESVGLLRQLAVFQRNNTIGLLDDRLVLGGVYSEGVTGFYGSYDLFLPGRLPILSFGYSQGETEIVDGPFRVLGVEGESQSYEVGITQPLVVTQRWLVQAGVRYAHTNSETDFAGLFVQEETIDTISLELSASRLDGSGGWFTQHQARYITADTLGQSENLFSLSGSLLRQHYFSRALSASLDLRYQLGDEGLPTSERFALGGVRSIRGYPESDTLTDNGYLARLEFAWMPLVESRVEKPRGFREFRKDFVASTQPFVFLDHGMGMDIERFDGSTESRMVNSVGAGLRFAVAQYVSLTATYAEPFDLQDGSEARNFLFAFDVRIPWGR